MKVAVRDGSTIGWQLQGAAVGTLRHGPPDLAGRSDASKAARIAYVDQHHKSWLQFGIERELGPFGSAPSADYKHFAPDFLYDYVRVPGLSIETLLALAERIAAEALRYSADFASTPLGGA